MKELLCLLFGHRWTYNFVRFPSKRECTRCGIKQREHSNPEYKGDLQEQDIFIWGKDY